MYAYVCVYKNYICVKKHVCIYVNEVGDDSVSPKKYRQTNKQNPSALGIANLYLSCWSKKSKRLPKQYRLLLWLLAASQNFKVRPCC